MRQRAKHQIPKRRRRNGAGTADTQRIPDPDTNWASLNWNWASLKNCWAKTERMWGKFKLVGGAYDFKQSTEVKFKEVLSDQSALQWHHPLLSWLVRWWDWQIQTVKGRANHNNQTLRASLCERSSWSSRDDVGHIHINREFHHQLRQRLALLRWNKVPIIKHQ